MILTMLKAKLHRATVTGADLHYEGSCGIDATLLEASGIREFQYIEIYNINNGERFSTYALRAAAGSGEVSLNGAAARKAMVGDLLIVTTYSSYSEGELATYHLAYSARADLCRRLGRLPEARASYEKALALILDGTRQEPERRFLSGRLEELKLKTGSAVDFPSARRL